MAFSLTLKQNPSPSGNRFKDIMLTTRGRVKHFYIHGIGKVQITSYDCSKFRVRNIVCLLKDSISDVSALHRVPRSGRIRRETYIDNEKQLVTNALKTKFPKMVSNLFSANLITSVVEARLNTIIELSVKNTSA